MMSKDLETMQQTEILEAMQTAAKANDAEEFAKSWALFAKNIQESILSEARELTDIQDCSILQSRGVRQLTSEERQYYTNMTSALTSDHPMQALSELDVVMPKTVIDRIFDDLQQNHPLLDAINFTNTETLTEYLINTHTRQLATWDALSSDITKELSSGFAKINLGMDKLSAYMPIAKDMLDLGPQWLDRYVRTVLSEGIAFGLEDAIINGNGKDQPVGMIRQIGTGTDLKEGLTLTSNEFPVKDEVVVNSLDPVAYGDIVSRIAQTPQGGQRVVGEVLMIVNPVDYLKTIMPATTMLTPNGGYVNNILPYPTKIVQSTQMAQGKAIFGMASRYFMGVGVGKSGKLIFSDDYKFLEDERIYAAKLYGHGTPLDNNAFIYADISTVTPATYRVSKVTTAVTGVSITGTVKVGKVLTAKTTPEDASVMYQWQIADTETGTYNDITGAQSKTYTPVTGDASKFIKVKVTGIGTHEGTAFSAATAAVAS